MSPTSCPYNNTYDCAVAAPSTTASADASPSTTVEASVASDLAVAPLPPSEECCESANICFAQGNYNDKLCCDTPQGGGSCPVDCYTGLSICHVPGVPISSSSCPSDSHVCLQPGANTTGCCPMDDVCTSSTGESICCTGDGGTVCGEDCSTCACTTLASGAVRAVAVLLAVPAKSWYRTSPRLVCACYPPRSHGPPGVHGRSQRQLATARQLGLRHCKCFWSRVCWVHVR